MAKILVVEDEYAISQVLKAYLKKVGFDVMQCFNGGHALDMFQKVQPDLAINNGDNIEKYIDVDEMLRYFAVNTALVNLDSCFKIQAKRSLKITISKTFGYGFYFLSC